MQSEMKIWLMTYRPKEADNIKWLNFCII